MNNKYIIILCFLSSIFATNKIFTNYYEQFSIEQISQNIEKNDKSNENENVLEKDSDSENVLEKDSDSIETVSFIAKPAKKTSLKVKKELS